MSNPLYDAIGLFASLPGIGRKSAARIVFHLLKQRGEQTRSLGESIAALPDRIKKCAECGNYSGEAVCEICSSSSRDRETVCVVEQSQDLHTIESTGSYRGLYHVLQGALSPLDGVGPEELRLGLLLKRVVDNSVKELIVATNPTLEGDSTALYIKQMFAENSCPVAITRIASGLPVGGDLEYADRLSIARAFEGRRGLD